MVTTERRNKKGLCRHAARGMAGARSDEAEHTALLEAAAADPSLLWIVKPAGGCPTPSHNQQQLNTQS